MQPVDQNSNAALLVSCPYDRFTDQQNSAPVNTGAQIRALIAPPRSIDSTPIWAPDPEVQQNILLSAEWISAAAWPAPTSDAGQKILLSAGESPLVVMRHRDAGTSAIVDTVVDMGHPQFIRQPEYAAFVAALADLATQRQLLDETISVARDLQSSIVIPAQVDAQSVRSAPSRRIGVTPLSSIFVLAALLLLALDTALLLTARRGARHA